MTAPTERHAPMRLASGTAAIAATQSALSPITAPRGLAPPVRMPGGTLRVLEPLFGLDLEVPVVGIDGHEEVMQEAL